LPPFSVSKKSIDGKRGLLFKGVFGKKQMEKVYLLQTTFSCKKANRQKNSKKVHKRMV
jgi:hypothetical protein